MSLTEKERNLSLSADFLNMHGLWAELRQNLGPQILAAENFNREYGKRFHQEPSKDLEDAIKHFAESITSQIDRLDQTSQDLIQIVRKVLFRFSLT